MSADFHDLCSFQPIPAPVTMQSDHARGIYSDLGEVQAPDIYQLVFYAVRHLVLSVQIV